MSAHQDSAVVVQDCDREAASPFMDRYLDGSSFADDLGNLAEAFARHRIEVTTTLREQRDELLESLEKYANDLCDYGTYNEGCGKFDELTCGGCLARAAVAKARGAA